MRDMNMVKAIVNYDYEVLSVDENGRITEDNIISVLQREDEVLEVWKERDDGFLFVYSDRLEIGYWCLPSHLTLTEKCEANKQ